jgi:hypothetical protein
MSESVDLTYRTALEDSFKLTLSLKLGNRSSVYEDPMRFIFYKNAFKDDSEIKQRS